MNTNTPLKQSKYQTGFTLVELGLVLLVVAVIGMFAYSKFMGQNQEVLASQESDNVTTYVSKTKKAYTNDSNFSTVTTDALRTNGIFPRSMVQGTTVVNNYQGTVTAAPNTVSNADDSVLFTSTNYTQEGCREIVPKIAAVAQLISVNGTVVKPLNARLDRVTLGTSCADEDNTVTFVISKN